MELEQLINVFGQLGQIMNQLGNNEDWTDYSLGLTREEYVKLQIIINKESILNPWFTKENVLTSLKGVALLLNKNQLVSFANKYSFTRTPKRVGVIMAGNLPLVGMHDLICVVLSGNCAVCKPSSQDSRLLPALVELLFKIEPKLKQYIEITLGKIGVIDAIIATGSSNSVVHFNSYFGHLPHVFRGNRTSVAVLNGNETEEELKLLGSDLFTYFGLGCRNVSYLILQNDFNLNRFFEAIVDYGSIINHHKYANNYDYNRTIYLMNQVPFLDNNFCLLKEDGALHSPLSVFHYSRKTTEETNKWLRDNESSIQVIVGKEYLGFGQTQTPQLHDFADGIDVMHWLNSL